MPFCIGSLLNTLAALLQVSKQSQKIQIIGQIVGRNVQTGLQIFQKWAPALHRAPKQKNFQLQHRCNAGVILNSDQKRPSSNPNCLKGVVNA